jgi:Cu(I)/Ag(I) efflux system membrane fusion protein
MKNKTLILALVAAGLLVAGGYGLYRMGMSRGMASAASAPSGTVGQGGAGTDPAMGKKVLYWHDPMVPGQKFDRPGKSPFMDMQLVPVYAGDAGDEGKVSISARVQQNLGIRTAEVTRGQLSAPVEAVGSVAYNERDVALVQARSNGFVERLYVRAPLDPVRKGQPLAELYVPEWVAAQEECWRRVAGRGAPAHAAGRHERYPDPAGRIIGCNAFPLDDFGADQRRDRRTRCP